METAGNSQIKNWYNGGFTKTLTDAATAADSQMRAKDFALADDILINQDAIIIPLYWSMRLQLSNPALQRTFSPVVFYERFEKWYFK
jgi:oligopeptide transport system substrate-binding protein